MNLKRIRHGSEMVLSARRGFVRRTLDDLRNRRGFVRRTLDDLRARREAKRKAKAQRDLRRRLIAAHMAQAASWGALR